jgi:choline dehydrogenase-like flavoprotein
LANLTGQYQIVPSGVWRSHSTFHPTTMRRRSSDTVLNRTNTNLEVRTGAKVTKILFDGDAAIPLGFRVSATDIPQARCVQLTSLEVLCVKPGGRIYLSAGAIHTPALLMRSGIGPNGDVFDNSQVGQNLVDKPAMLLAGSFHPGFDTTERALFAHIAATQSGPFGTQLYEDLNLGVDSMLTLAAWQRNFVPTSLRNTFFAETAVGLVDFCNNQNLETDPTPNPLCNDITPLVKAGCHKNIYGVACLIGEPTSRGTVTLNGMGQVKVGVNYLSTDHDLSAFGASVRTGFSIVPALTGASAPQLPCTDPSNATCKARSCPDLITDYVEHTKRALRLVMPRQAYKMKSAPTSVVYPQFIPDLLANATLDDLSFGRLIRDEIFAAHHFAGSASIGTVVDSSRSFAVIGTSGLYVADASMLRTTPRGNPMATVMALGHIAGLHAVAEMSV